MLKEKSLSVIIPNYNGKRLLEKNLPSVITALQNSGLVFEILVVDDGSTDDSVDFVAHNYPTIKLLRKAINTGFSATCNFGITHAKHNYIMLLNSDIQLQEDYFEGQMDYFKDPDTFGVMAQIRGADDLLIQDTARLFTLSGFKIKPNTFFSVQIPRHFIPTAYLSGANAIIDAQKLKMLSGFDELYSPFYYEDFDLGLRAWRVGWKCYYHPGTYCLHEQSSTTKNYRTKNWVKSIYFRNKMMVHAIHLEGFSLIAWYTRLMAETLVMWLFGKFYFYKSLMMFVSNFDQINQSRRRLKLKMKEQGKALSFKDVQHKMMGMLEGETLIYGLQQAV